MSDDFKVFRLAYLNEDIFKFKFLSLSLSHRGDVFSDPWFKASAELPSERGDDNLLASVLRQDLVPPEAFPRRARRLHVPRDCRQVPRGRAEDHVFS